MTPLGALLELLARLGASLDAAVLVSKAELRCWPLEAVRQLKAQKLLVRRVQRSTWFAPAVSRNARCLYTHTAATGSGASFVVCDKQDDINRVPVAAEQLRQWRCGAEAVRAFVAQNLGLRPESEHKANRVLWELGLVTGKKRSQMVCLRANGNAF